MSRCRSKGVSFYSGAILRVRSFLPGAGRMRKGKEFVRDGIIRAIIAHGIIDGGGGCAFCWYI